MAGTGVDPFALSSTLSIGEWSSEDARMARNRVKSFSKFPFYGVVQCIDERLGYLTYLGVC